MQATVENAQRDAWTGHVRPGSAGRRAAGWLVLETPRATVLYWFAVGLVVVALFLPRLLPCVDYPQHLGLSDILRRLGDPAAPEHRVFRLNYFTYNGLFHATVGWLARALPIELAGRAVVAFALTALAGGVVALLHAVGRPPVHAALFVPVLFSFSLGWGFVNYVLATAIATWALALVARAVVHPSRALAIATAVLGLACGFAHVLGLIVLCATALPLALERGWRTGPRGNSLRRLTPVLVRAARAVLPLVPGGVYCVMVYREQYAWDPRLYRDPVLEGTGPTVWRKLRDFGTYTLDLFPDPTGRALLWGAIAVMLCAVGLAWRRRAEGTPREDGAPREPQGPALFTPLVTVTFAYLATPAVLMGTHLIFQRLGQWVVLAAVLAMPAFPAALGRRLHGAILALAVASGFNVALHCALYARETDDASRVIDELPADRAATAVIWDPGTLAFRKGTLTHLAAYYAARKHGRWAFAFARYLSLPVRFLPGAQPPWPAKGWEFNAKAYDARCRYARAFPLVIVKAPRNVPEDASGEDTVRRLVFRQDAQAVKLLAHHGHYWAFDTAGLPDDGTS
jgi:hypothetical protein